MTKRSVLGAITVALLVTGTTIGTTVGTTVGAGAGTRTPGGVSRDYEPKIRPADFGGPIDNPYFPLVPGARWVYDVSTPTGPERIVVEVTHDTKEVLGIDAVVVRDTVSKDGALVEDTFDWYAQDTAGNVWYLGEDTKEYENGVAVNTKGSWEAGVDGAQPGIVMKAHPRVGATYRQEFYKGEAEDRARVLSVSESASVSFGTFERDIVKTKDITPLQPGLVEHKYYARDIGVVLEIDVKGGSERVELVEHTTP